MIVMRPAAGVMEVAMLPAVQRSFTSYALTPDNAVRQAAE
jgi:hypothetical protein